MKCILKTIKNATDTRVVIITYNIAIHFVYISVRSQFILKSIRTHFVQFVLNVWSIRTHLVKFSQLVLILVNSYSVWSIRTHTKNINFEIYIIS